MSNSAMTVKRRRAQLSCDECKQRKVSCDRQWPCIRCTRNARNCVYSTKHITNDSNALAEQLARHPDSARILSNLQAMLGLPSPAQSLDQTPLPVLDDNFEDELINVGPPSMTTQDDSSNAKPPTSLMYERHYLFKFFTEMPELYSYVHKIVHHMGHPSAIKKVKPIVCTTPNQNEILELVSIFMSKIPYKLIPDEFDPLNTTTEESRMLLLAIMSCATPFTEDHLQSPYYWIQDIDRWLRRKRNVAWYRISIIAYQAKRIHCLEKTRHWEKTGKLYRAARMDNLRQKSPELWEIICELDIQASIEFGMPTMVDDTSIELEVCNALLSRGTTTTNDNALALSKRLDPSRHAAYIIMLNDQDDWLSLNVVSSMAKKILAEEEDIRLGDLYLAIFTLVKLTLHHGMGSPGDILPLLQKGLQHAKRRYLHTCVGEPWCVLSILAAIAILSAHWKLMEPGHLLETATQHFREVYNAGAVDIDTWDWSNWLATTEF